MATFFEVESRQNSKYFDRGEFLNLEAEIENI